MRGSRKIVQHSDSSSNKGEAVLLLRWVLIIATSYLVVFSRPLGANSVPVALFVAVYFASNIVFTELQPRFRSLYAFDISVVLVDTAMVSIGLALTRAASSEFYVIYFIIMFLSALTERLGLVVGAALLISGTHLYTEARFVGWNQLMTPTYTLRIPFLFVVAMFFGNLVQDARRREHENEEARARERRMEFLSGVSHDLKNPLSVIQSLATLLLDGDAGTLNSQQTDLVRRIHASARYVITFAFNIIDAARIEAGRLSLQPRAVNLKDIVDDTLLLARSASDLKGITLQCSVQPDLPTTNIDAAQMERVISNIMGNAIKFTPPGGRIELSARQAGDHIVLSVHDSGPGIDPNELPTVFQKYRFQAGNNHADGSGLGLFIVKAIVEAHGGRVDLSSPPGDGTTVTVQLPALGSEWHNSTDATPRRPDNRRRWPFALRARLPGISADTREHAPAGS